jgi:hypothetical protein
LLILGGLLKFLVVEMQFVTNPDVPQGRPQGVRVVLAFSDTIKMNHGTSTTKFSLNRSRVQELDSGVFLL